MSKHALYQHLRGVPMLADLNAHELEAVGRVTSELSIAAGKVLIEEGSTAHEMFVVVEGSLTVTHDGDPVASIGPGSFAGELGLLTGAKRNSTVAAAEDSQVLHVDGRSFAALLADVPTIAVKMLPVVADRAVEVTGAT